MARYKVVATLHRSGKPQVESEVFSHYGDDYRAAWEALDRARLMNLSHGKTYKTIVVLRDSEGADHPDNRGKFFLDRIVK